MEDELLLEEQDRAKLDGIVAEMESNGEKPEDIQFVVNDFKSKYGKAKQTGETDFLTGPGDTAQEPAPLKKKEDTQSSPSQSPSGGSGSASTSDLDRFSDAQLKSMGIPTRAEEEQRYYRETGSKDLPQQTDADRKFTAGVNRAVSHFLSLPNTIQKTMFGLLAPEDVQQDMANLPAEAREDVINTIFSEINPVEKYFGINVGKLSSDAQDYLMGNVQKLTDSMEKFDTSINEDFGQGNYVQGIKRTKDEVFGAIPSILEAFIPYVGIGAIVTGEAGNKLEELEKEGENLEGKTIANAWVNGAAEGIFEIVTKKLGGRMLRAMENSPMDSKTILKSVLEGFGGTSAEALSEASTSYVQNLSDQIIQGREVDWDRAWNEIIDAGLIGGVTGFGMSGTTSAIEISNTLKEKAQERNAQKFMTEEQKSDYLKSKKEVDEVVSIMNDPNTPESVKEDLNAIAEEKAQKMGDLQGTVMEQMDGYNMDSALGIMALDGQIRDVKKTFNDLRNNPDISQGLKEEAYGRIRKKLEDLRKQKEELLNKQTQQPNEITGEENVSERTQGFFSDVVEGNLDKYKPSRPYEYELPFNEKEEAFKETYDTFKGNFDEHIATSIPTFRDIQIKKGAAIQEILPEGGLVYDLGGSEGGFVKTLTSQSNGKIRSINVEPNKDMAAKHRAKPVEGSEVVEEAFQSGFDGIKAYQPSEKGDVVHESMLFQFMSKDRAKKIREVKDKYLKDDGVFITEEKFQLKDKDQQAENERLKDTQHKSKYYTEEQIKQKGESVLVGMGKNQADLDQYLDELSKEFKHVGTYWTAGNFRGIVATNNKAKFDAFMKSTETKGEKYTTGAKKVQQPKPEESGFNYKKLMSGFPVLSYVDEKVFQNLVAKPLENFVTKQTKKALQSENKIKRNVAEIATGWFNGLARTDREIANKRRLVGEQEASFIKGKQVAHQLHNLIGNDIEMARRVHAAMDPDIYKEGERLTYDQLNDQEKALYDSLREINDRTHQLNYDEGFISEKTYEKYKDKYIGRGYEVYEDGIEDLEKELFVDTKLGLEIYKQRREIDQWKIDNKVKDPIYLTVNRMIRTERNMAVKRYADIVNSTLAKEEASPGYSKITGKNYGSLDGKYVPNYIVEDFKGYHFANSIMDNIYEASQIYDKTKVRQLLKRVHTVYSLPVQFGNFMSNHAFAFSAGVNIVQLWKNIPQAYKELNSKSGDFLTLLEEGIVNENILTKDLRLTDEGKKAMKTKKGLMRFINKADDKAKNIYSGSDDLMKLAAYKALRKVGYTKDESIQRVFEGFQNYASVGKVWDLAAKLPIFGNPYIKFQADLMRIVKNSTLKRPLTTAAFLSSVQLMTYLLSKYYTGESDDEREIRESRPFIPKINTPFKNIPLVARLDNKEVNLARFLSPYYEYDIPGEDWLQQITRFTPLQVQVSNPDTGERTIRLKTSDVLLGPFVQAFITNRDFRNKPVTDPDANKYSDSGLTLTERLANQVVYVGRSIVPLYSTIDDTRRSILYGEDYYGRDKTALDIIVSRLVKVQTWDSNTTKDQVIKSLKSINYKAKEINTKITTINNKFAKDVEELNTRLKDGVITQEQFDNKYERMYNASLERAEIQMQKLVKEQEKLNELYKKINNLGIRE